MFDTSSKVGQLATYIEENLRASRSAGLDFIDLRNFKGRLSSRQNHVVFGRRGAGKSTLVSSLSNAPNVVVIHLNLEDYKDITFPNIILHIFQSSFERLYTYINEKHPWYRFNVSAFRFTRSLKAVQKNLYNQIHEPDSEQQLIKSRSAAEGEASASIAAGPLGIGGGVKETSEQEVTRTLPKDKLGYLRLELSKFKKIFASASALCGNEPVFLVFDDFYFVPKSTQPELIDYFHRLTKDTNLFIKVATIKHRSRLFRRSSENSIGVELGHDIFEIDMDYTLDNFADLQSFMRQLLESANTRSDAKLKIDELFAGDGFSQLCLASGGVPRDFLSLFVRVANKVAVTSSLETIGKVLVNEEAIASVGSKMENLMVDSREESGILEAYLSIIRSIVYDEHRTNAFLVPKEDMETYQRARQALRELVDLRLIHLVEQNTSSAPSDGRRYEAYILDIGLYENARPRNFKQIELGVTDDKARKDELRAAPRLGLFDVEEEVKETMAEAELILTES